MRHCPECHRPYRSSVTICPECWTSLAEGPPPPATGRMTLVYEARTFFEADMIEAYLRDEGIPCLRVPARGALPAAFMGPMAATNQRLFVRSEVATLAAELIDEITGGDAGR